MLTEMVRLVLVTRGGDQLGRLEIHLDVMVHLDINRST
jgi:hypothetical protein